MVTNDIKYYFCDSSMKNRSKGIQFSKLRKYPLVFLRMTGLKIDEFDKISETCSRSWSSHMSKKKQSGRPFSIGDLNQQLLCLFLYYRVYTSQIFLGFLFSVDAATICRCINRLEKIVAKKIHIKKDRQITEEQLKDLLVDCTEQSIQRPKKKQKLYYSGKKKQHSIKTEIHCSLKGEILHVSKSFPGRIHDFSIRKKGPPLLTSSNAYADSGYQGLADIHHNTFIPYKRSKNNPLTRAQKLYNKALSTIRVTVEHKFRQIKIFQILTQRYRNPLNNYNRKFNIIAGIVNLKYGFSF